jgi:hypothetical protein
MAPESVWGKGAIYLTCLLKRMEQASRAYYFEAFWARFIKCLLFLDNAANILYKDLYGLEVCEAGGNIKH